jgi:hypothetical protein
MDYLLPHSTENQLDVDQPPLGTQFKSYELNSAINYYTLDPFQYSITKFKYNNFTQPNGPDDLVVSQKDFKRDPGLIYRGVDFETLLPAYTAVKKSVNDVPAQDYHRFQANEGYFNPNEGADNSDLWYYGADNISRMNDIGLAGAPLNVQEVNHIIFPEPQRGGLDSRNVTKYSWSNTPSAYKNSWGAENQVAVNNNTRCENFNYNSSYFVDKNKLPFERVYSFDSNYCRDIGISPEYTGSMPFNPGNIN